jgi:O-antigen ligase
MQMIPSGKSLTFKDLLQNGSLSFGCAALTVILLPVYHWYLPPIMIAWGLLRVIEISQTADPLSQIKKGRITLFFFFIVFYAWQILGIVYSENPDAGWRNIVLRMSLFLFPLVLFSPGDTIRRRAGYLVRLFALSNLMFLIFCYGFAVWRSITIIDGTIGFNPHPQDAGWLNNFYAMKLAVFQHPSYLSMYTLLSVFVSIEAFYDKKLTIVRRKLWLLISMFLLLSVYFLSSRAEILAAVISIPFYFFRRSKRTGRSRTVVLAVLLSILILVPLFLTNPRVNGLFRTLSHKENNNISAQDGRLIIWTTVAKIAYENLLLGVGTGDIQDELDKEYIRIGKTNFAKDNFNAHNQYIEILLENGAIGLFLFLSIFGMILYIAVKDWNLIYAMFILIVFISFLFETMLNRLAGVSFFALFSFLLSFVDSDYDSENP